jgi:hypothetical protein
MFVLIKLQSNWAQDWPMSAPKLLKVIFYGRCIAGRPKRAANAACKRVPSCKPASKKMVSQTEYHLNSWILNQYVPRGIGCTVRL